MKKNSLFSFYSRSLGFTISAQSEPQAPVVVSQIIRPGPPRAPRHPVCEEKIFLENWWWRVCEDSKKLPCFLENILCFPILFLVIKDSSHTDSCNFHVLEDLTFQLFSEPFQETTSLTLGLHQWGPTQLKVHKTKPLPSLMITSVPTFPNSENLPRIVSSVKSSPRLFTYTFGHV